jgi:hypothetical protein
MECPINANAIYCWIRMDKEKKARNPLIISKKGEQKKGQKVKKKKNG